VAVAPGEDLGDLGRVHPVKMQMFVTLDGRECRAGRVRR